MNSRFVMVSEFSIVYVSSVMPRRTKTLQAVQKPGFLKVPKEKEEEEERDEVENVNFLCWCESNVCMYL